MIKVVHITENPIAGAPINLSLALNKWQATKVQSRHIAASDRNENRIFKTDLLTTTSSYAELKKVIVDADILHFHNFYSNQDLFRRFPDLWKVCLKKKRVWQVHSPRTTGWINLEEGVRDPAAKHLVIGQYHPRQWPECTVVPNIVDITEDLLKPLPHTNPKPRIAFSPSRIRLPGWDNKGYDETVPVLQRLVDDGLATAEVIFNVPHEDCLRRRVRADISIDEIITGSYHLCSLESLSQGLVTIAGLDDLQIQTLRDLTGSTSLPWVVANATTLEQKLRELIADPEALVQKRLESRAWMEKFWHPRDMTAKFVDIYEAL